MIETRVKTHRIFVLLNILRKILILCYNRVKNDAADEVDQNTHLHVTWLKHMHQFRASLKLHRLKALAIPILIKTRAYFSFVGTIG